MAQDKKLTESEVIDGLNKLGARAMELGLIPDDGAKISKRGEFIVGESNVEEDENRKQRGYRHKSFPKAVHAWGPDPVTGEEGPLQFIVNNAAELEKAIAVGWSVESVHGPAGRIVGGEVVLPSESETEVREIQAPGAVQPHTPSAQTGTKELTKAAPKVKTTKAAPKKK